MLPDTSSSATEWPVPERFVRAHPTQWAERGAHDYPSQWETARDWLLHFPQYLVGAPDPELIGHGLLLTGPPGTGKTMLACAMLNYLRAKHWSVAFVRDRDLVKVLANNFPTDDLIERLWLLERCACLVVDDALRMGGKSELLEPFLRYRQDEGKVTIVTMNNEVMVSQVLDSFLHSFTAVQLAGLDRRISPIEVTGARW